MAGKIAVRFVVAAVMLVTVCTLHAQQQSDDSGGSGNSKGGSSKTGESKSATAAKSTDGSSVCTVRPGTDGSTKDASGGGKDSSSNGKSGSSDPSVQVNQYASAQAKAPATTKNSTGTKSKNVTYRVLELHAGNSNAAEIAPQLKDLSQTVISAIAINPGKILVLLDASQKKPNDPDSVKASLQAFVYVVERAGPQVFAVALEPGTGKACDVARALVDSNPYITEISAVDDSRLFISLSGATPNFSTVEAELKKQVKELAAPATSSEPQVSTLVQRLYYNHDPTVVATIINDAYPNVAAHAVRPDVVVLSDPADLDDGKRRGALEAAQRTIARVDQPHPQVSVDAWSLQLATEKKDLGTIIPRLEDLAGAYNAAIDLSLGRGWQYLSQQIGNSSALDPLLNAYLTSTTRVDRNGKVTRLDQSYAQDQNKQPLDPNKASGYGLGFATLYYPLTPNLIDMLVTLASVNKPREAAANMLCAMGTPPPPEEGRAESSGCQIPSPLIVGQTCRERDASNYASEIKAQSVKIATGTQNGMQPDTTTPAHPIHLQLGCVRDVLMKQLFVESGDSTSTSSLGQMRAALADFLFQYKLMVEYPEEFHSYLEPIAADTLDSAFVPIVSAFDEDLSAFQAKLQEQIAAELAEKKKHLSYGYGGLISLKVLSAQAGSAKTATQNYFDATPPATLNDLLTNLQALNKSDATSPLTALGANLPTAKAMEVAAALGQTLTPKPTTAHLGRGLDLTVTAHTLSGAIGAELDLEVQSTENGAGLIQQGSTKTTDDLNSRVSQHTVNTHVRLASIDLFKISTLGSALARGQEPWKPFDPIEVPVLSLVVKVPKKPKIVYTQSLVFVDAVVVPTAADLGYGVPIIEDQLQVADGRYKNLKELKRFPNKVGYRILQYHDKIVDCLNREYVGTDGNVHTWVNNAQSNPCQPKDFNMNDVDVVE